MVFVGLAGGQPQGETVRCMITMARQGMGAVRPAAAYFSGSDYDPNGASADPDERWH